MNRKPVPARVTATQERRRCNAAGVHKTRRHPAKGGRHGAKLAAIREQG